VFFDVLVPLAWTCWAILLGAVLVSTVWVVRDTEPTPEVGPEFGWLVIACLYVLVIGAGGVLYAFTQIESLGGVLTMAVLLGFPVVILIAEPTVRAYQEWSFNRRCARVGKFRDPALRTMAEAIRAGDSAALRQLLGGAPPPPGRDRAGHDLFGYALAALRDRKQSLDCVRALLEVGSDPVATRMPDGRAPIHYMIVDITPSGREAVRLLLNHGADPNAVDPITGDTPLRGAGDSPELVRALVEAGADVDRIQANGVTVLVDFVAERNWESAHYLVERGARLDVVNEDGPSLDYYLKDWKDSVFGEHPEGWDRLRAAIAARREGKPRPA